MFGLGRRMGSFGIFRFWGTPGGAGAPALPESMVARGVGRTGRNGRKGDESRGDRDLEFGKCVSATKSLRRSYFPQGRCFRASVR
jgi:hypothetical protein